MSNLPPLTERQHEVLRFIQKTIETHGYPPTVREIGEHLGIRSTNGVADHLKALKRKGYLAQQQMKSRTLTPLQGGAEAARGSTKTGRRRGTDTALPVALPRGGATVSIPILGRVAAGEPILAEEHAEGTVVIDSTLVGDGRRLFALKVVGDSMIDDGIHDGDYIFVQKRSHAEPGSIVVVMIENEATVKRIYPEGDRVRLQPANAAMRPIYVRARDFRDTQILGVVVGVYRRV